MAEERAAVTWEELAWSNHIEQEAIVRLLISKGLISQTDFIEEVKQVQDQYASRKCVSGVKRLFLQLIAYSSSHSLQMWKKADNPYLY